MRSGARTVGSAFLLGGLLLGTLLPPSRVVGQPAPQSVTTDTPEYCLHLVGVLGHMVATAQAAPPSEVASLSSEGQRMCDEGQVRGGILRLRRALLMMRGSTRDAP